LLTFVTPRYAREGRSYLTVAVGCTGGRHRSVMMAEALGKRVKKLGFPVSVKHRDIAK
jgi:RNase adapter protein RapZ